MKRYSWFMMALVSALVSMYATCADEQNVDALDVVQESSEDVMPFVDEGILIEDNVIDGIQSDVDSDDVFIGGLKNRIDDAFSHYMQAADEFKNECAAVCKYALPDAQVEYDANQRRVQEELARGEILFGSSMGTWAPSRTNPATIVRACENYAQNLDVGIVFVQDIIDKMKEMFDGKEIYGFLWDVVYDKLKGYSYYGVFDNQKLEQAARDFRDELKAIVTEYNDSQPTE